MPPMYLKDKSALGNYFYNNSMAQKRRGFCCSKFKMSNQGWWSTLAISKLGRLNEAERSWV